MQHMHNVSIMHVLHYIKYIIFHVLYRYNVRESQKRCGAAAGFDPFLFLSRAPIFRLQFSYAFFGAEQFGHFAEGVCGVRWGLETGPGTGSWGHLIDGGVPVKDRFPGGGGQVSFFLIGPGGG